MSSDEPRVGPDCGAEVTPETDALLRQLAAGIRRREPALDPGLDARVMAAVRRSPHWRIRTLRAWWVRPRPVAVSPLQAVLAMGALAALVLASIRHPLDRGPWPAARATIAPVAGHTLVRFVLSAPGATQVHLVGDFNAWNRSATPLDPVGAAGVWTVEVPLAPGRHEYAFVVDGRQWLPDPAAPRAPANDYGPPNSMITVGLPRS